MTDEARMTDWRNDLSRNVVQEDSAQMENRKWRIATTSGMCLTLAAESFTDPETHCSSRRSKVSDRLHQVVSSGLGERPSSHPEVYLYVKSNEGAVEAGGESLHEFVLLAQLWMHLLDYYFYVILLINTTPWKCALCLSLSFFTLLVYGKRPSLHW